jgi:hypothetical protein
MGNAVANFNLSDETICQPAENQLYLTISAVAVILIGLAFVFAGNKLIRVCCLIMSADYCHCRSLAICDTLS